MRAYFVLELIMRSAGVLATLTALAMSFSQASAAEPEQARVSELVRQLASPDKTDKERAQISQSLKKAKASIVLPAVLAERERRFALKGFEPIGGALLAANTDVRIPLALYDVWTQVLEADKSNAKLLAVMFKSVKSDFGRSILVAELRGRDVPEAEGALAAIMRDEKNPQDLVLSSADLLVENWGKKYGPELLARVSDKNRSLDVRGIYLSSYQGPGFKAMETKDQKKLILAGFALLAESRDYFSACKLEFFTGKEFKPNQKDPKYQGENGLKKAFFEDTVKNALSWWKDNQKKYE